LSYGAFKAKSIAQFNDWMLGCWVTIPAVWVPPLLVIVPETEVTPELTVPLDVKVLHGESPLCGELIVTDIDVLLGNGLFIPRR
jgi:hypothetical protein